ncbi:MAG: tRNA 5-hydroxyuridine modification protein YegQ [Cardiobacteriaceae bacterium]|nr:tRNA 5-hydroxyuridine modification protein YegQ [Cardiobacteriaceae bacterium]
MNRKIELLSPAGSPKTMRYAFAYGADAVYAGSSRYSLRMRGNQFNEENLKESIDEAHSLGKKFYLTVNTQPHNYKLQTAIRDLELSAAAKPDAFIMSDPGLIMLVREAFPDIVIHLSVQANTVNWATVQFWKSVGISRCILSRELTLKEIAEIREKCPDTEIEVFIHGALCIAYSGRCLLSGYFNNRDPNQGTCTNACRWKYKTHNAISDGEGGFIPTDANIFSAEEFMKISNNSQENFTEDRHYLADRTYFLEEENRPNEYMEISEDDNGTYIMNSRDLRAIEHISELVKIGVDCLKIEGRTKSHYYAARTAQIYRQAIDDALAGKSFNPNLYYELDGLANRGYTDGFFVKKHSSQPQNYEFGSSVLATRQFVGEVIGFNPNKNRVLIEVKNKFEVNNQVEIYLPQKSIKARISAIYDIKTGEYLEAAKGSGWVVEVDFAILNNDIDGQLKTNNEINNIAKSNHPFCLISKILDKN